MGQRQDGLPQAGPCTATWSGSFTRTAALPIGLLCEREINYFVKTLIFQDFIALAASVSLPNPCNICAIMLSNV